MKIQHIFFLLFLLHQVSSFQIKCNAGLSRVLSFPDIPTIDCEDNLVCEIDCSEIFKNRVGVCYGKEVLNFKINDAEAFNEVCLMKNYGENDSIHFSKIIIMKEIGVKENEVESTDLYQEYLFQYQMKNMMEYCKNSKNGQTTFERELRDLDRKSKSNERLNRLKNIREKGQEQVLEKLYLFHSNKRCECKAFEKYYESNPTLYKAYKDRIISACSRHYPDCIEKDKVFKFRRESNDDFTIRKRALEDRAFAWRVAYLKRKGVLYDTGMVYKKEKHNSFFFQERLRECQNCSDEKRRKLENKIRSIEARERNQSEILNSIQEPSISSYDVDKDLLYGRITVKRIIFDLSTNYRDVPSCNNLDAQRIERVPNDCKIDYILYMGNIVPYHTYSTRERCTYKFNYNDCIQRYCFVAAYDFNTENNWIKTDVDITNREVCEGTDILYESRDFYCTVINYKIGGTYAEQLVKREVRVSYPQGVALEINEKNGLTIRSSWGNFIRSEGEIPRSSLRDCFDYNVFGKTCRKCVALIYESRDEKRRNIYRVLSQAEEKPGCIDQSAFEGCFAYNVTDTLFERAFNKINEVPQRLRNVDAVKAYNDLRLREKREEIKKCYESNCLNDKDLIRRIYQQTCGPKGSDYFDEMRHVFHSNINSMRSYYLNVNFGPTKNRALEKLEEEVKMMEDEYKRFDKIYQDFKSIRR